MEKMDMLAHQSEARREAMFNTFPYVSRIIDRPTWSVPGLSPCCPGFVCESHTKVPLIYSIGVRYDPF